MRVAFCWPEINGYMSACWRHLASLEGLEVFVVAGRPGALLQENAYNEDLTAGIHALLLDSRGLSDYRAIVQALGAFSPDVVVLPGWMIPTFTRLAFDPGFSAVRFVLALDNPREDTIRQKLARFRIGGYLARMRAVVVPGERAWQFARHVLRVEESRLFRGLYGIDHESFGSALAARQSLASWPRRFVFVGRYAPIKGLDVLVEGYRRYRMSVPDPWPLDCCGRGELAGELGSEPGVTDRGFVQPAQLPGLLAEVGVSVFPSRRDPWPLALVEHCAAGLPVIASNACGSAVEVLRPYYNGLLVSTEDPASLATALRWAHDHHASLPKMGERGRELAEPYSAGNWSSRWQALLMDLVGA